MSNSANKQTSQTWVPVAGPVLTPEGTPAAPDLVQPHLRHLESRDVTVAPSFPPGDWARTACKAHSPGHLQKAGSVLVIPHVEEVPSLPRLWVITRGTGTWDCGPLLGETGLWTIVGCVRWAAMSKPLSGARHSRDAPDAGGTITNCLLGVLCEIRTPKFQMTVLPPDGAPPRHCCQSSGGSAGEPEDACISVPASAQACTRKTPECAFGLWKPLCLGGSTFLNVG